MKRAVLWIGLPVLLLLAALAWGYAAAPGLIKTAAQDWVASNLKNKALSIASVRVDPLQLRVDLAGISLVDTRAPGRPLLKVKALAVDASMASFWALAPRLDSVTVTEPFIAAVLRRDGSLNLLELVPPDDGSPPPDVSIGRLTVARAQLDFTDQRRAALAVRRIRPADFALNDFATRTNAGGGFQFAGTTDAGEGLQWDGTLGMAPVMSKGHFTLTNLDLAGLGALAGAALPVQLTAGVLDIAGSYDAALLAAADGKVPPPQLAASITSLVARDVALKTPTGEQVTLASVSIAPTRFGLADDVLALGEVKLSGLGLRRPSGERASIATATLAASRHVISTGQTALGAFAASDLAVIGRGKGAETIRLARLAVDASRIDTDARVADIGAVALAGLAGGGRIDAAMNASVPGLWPMALPKPASGAGPAWRGSVAGITVKDAAFTVTAARPGGSRVLRLAPVNVTLGPIDSALAGPMQFSADARLNREARLAVAGTLTNAMAGAVDVTLTGLPLADVAALGDPLPVTVASGSMDVAGKLLLGNRRGPRFQGRMTIAGLDLEGKDGHELLGWQRLDVTGISVTPQQLAIKRIVFDTALSSVVVTRERAVNVMTAAGMEQPFTAPDAPSTVEASAAAAESAAPEPAASPPPAKRAVSAAISQSASAIGALIPTKVDTVMFRNSRIVFRDLSVEPNFSAQIDGFSGTVTGLSTRPGSQATFDLQGYVIDRFSPVAITGKANVFAYDANTDLKAVFTNIELPVFNPYSGRYAGYNIAKGKLSTTLRYRINNRALDAQHSVRIDQLTWGEATDSKDKVPLPLRLATSLLKDSNGVIDLDLPVGGTLDDPKFRIWPLVWKVVGNVLGNIVTAPFRMIGALFGGGGEQAQFILFDPGSAVLPPAAAERLRAIAKGLTDKPEVSLDIPAGPGTAEDAAVLARRALDAAVLLPKPGKPPLAATVATLTPARKLDRLKAVFKAKTGKGPKIPDDVAPGGGGLFAGGNARAAAATAQNAWLEGQLLPLFQPTPAALAALGQARADAVKAALLADSAIPADRVFVATNLGMAAKDGQIEMELKVK